MSTSAFFVAPTDELAGRIAERFMSGGRLLAFGEGANQHVALEVVSLFANPPYGKPLPALAADSGDAGEFASKVVTWSRPEDIALGVAAHPDSPAVRQAFDEAHRRGLLTVALGDEDGGELDAVESVDCYASVLLDTDTVFDLWKRVQLLMAS